MTRTHQNISDLFLAYLISNGFEPDPDSTHAQIVERFKAARPDFRFHEFHRWLADMDRAAASARRGVHICRLGQAVVDDHAERMAFVWSRIEGRVVA
ncbi:hypothetical protein [Acuticoccus sediminis]|uniref:hypothetical protein n=1 Tax=Acuticoccus sediminis TaxID=2184697 RepID=UPI001CFCFF41|nr:hypothetical protein [Acuticoccus sediminis]